jgi:uncharacterized membrane protein
MERDPIQEMEKMVREMHDVAGHYARPVFRRYPLLFSFLIVFSIAAILDGFHIFVGEMPMFKEHPSYLMILGVLLLFFTGKLYESLDKMK